MTNILTLLFFMLTSFLPGGNNVFTQGDTWIVNTQSGYRIGVNKNPGAGWTFSIDDDELRVDYLMGEYGTLDVWVDGFPYTHINQDNCSYNASPRICADQPTTAMIYFHGAENAHHEIFLLNSGYNYVNFIQAQSKTEVPHLFLPMLGNEP